MEERRQAQLPWRTEWTQNQLYLAGLQWHEYSTVSGQFWLRPKAPWKERPVWNMLKPFAKTFMAKLTKNRPVTACVPRSSDDADVHAAQLGDDILRQKWIELKLGRKLRALIAWVTATGNGWIGGYWNRHTGKMEPLTALVETDIFDAETREYMGRDVKNCPCDENGDPIMDKNGCYDMEAEPAAYDVGDLGVRVYSPYQVFPNSGATDEDEITDFLIIESRPVRQIRRDYPDVEGIMPEDTSEYDTAEHLMGLARQAGADTHYAGPQFDRTDTGELSRRALVAHWYEKPSEYYPRGRYWSVCCKALLEPPQPLPDDLWPPVVHMKDIEVEGQLLGESTMTAAVGIQREINEHAAKQKEHHKLMVNGKYLVPIASGVRKGAITTRPGEVIQYHGTLEPKQMEIRPLPAAVYQEREKLLEAFRTITSLHEVSQGKQPPGVTAGRALLTLQEADDTDLGPVTQGLEEAVAHLSWQLIQLAQGNYDDERLLRITGRHKVYQIRHFKGADLDAIVDVEPVVGSSFPWNKTARQSALLDWVQVMPGLFMDPNTGMFDPLRFRDALPIGGEEAIGNAADMHTSAALREEDMYLGWDGTAATYSLLPTPQAWHDDAIHMRTHEKVLNSANFYKWPPLNQQAFIDHYFAHRLAQQSKVLANMELQAAAAGALMGPTGDQAGGGGGGMPPTQGPVLHNTETAASPSP